MARARRIIVWLVGVVVVTGLVLERALALAGSAPTDFDDAYMYLRYARHLVDGYGMSWNIGEGSVYGVTSLLHLGVVTMTLSAFPRLPAAGILQVASGAAALALLSGFAALAILLSRALRPHARFSEGGVVCGVAVVALVAFRHAFIFHAGTGMDTMLSALANTAVVLATVHLARTATVATAMWAALAGLIAVLARPENVVCAFASPLLALLLGPSATRTRATLTFVFSLLAGLAALALATTMTLGSPVPLSFFAKQPGYYRDFAGEYGWNPFLFLKAFFVSAWPFAAAALAFMDRTSWRSLCSLLAPTLVSVAALFFFNQIMGHLGRFYYPFLPFFAGAAIIQWESWRRRHPTVRDVGAWLTARMTLLRAAGVVALFAGGDVAISRAAAAFDSRAQEPVPFVDYVTPAKQPLPDVDSWQAARAVAAMAAAAPRGTSFAMSEHGLPGALAPGARIVDMLGLHDPHVARHGFSAVELFRRKPDVIWFPHPDHGGMMRALLESDELWQHHDVYPDAFFFGIAVRSDGSARTQLVALLLQQWKLLYPGYDIASYEARRIDR